jgi:hypothetical protein
VNNRPNEKMKSLEKLKIFRNLLYRRTESRCANPNFWHLPLSPNVESPLSKVCRSGWTFFFALFFVTLGRVGLKVIAESFLVDPCSNPEKPIMAF